MVEKEFMNRIANGQEDILQQFLNMLGALKIAYCVIGGLAVNAYVEPVVSLDLDMAVAADSIDRLSRAAKQMFTLKEFPHSLNLSTPRSDLRIQLQRDLRYQSFIRNASDKNVMGYEMKVAALEDVIQGKIWAYSDEQKRKSKRQKDLADIFRLIESYPHLEDLLPESLKKML
jgi:hypothetical protein